MKKFTYVLSRLAAVIAAFAMIACIDGTTDENDPNNPQEPENPDQPTTEIVSEMAAELVEVGTSTAKIKLTTKNITQYAYLKEKKDADFSADIIFATGVKGKCTDGQNVITVTNLNPSSNYVIIFTGATVDEEFHPELVKVELTTEGFTEELTFFDIDYKSVAAHLNYPHDKVQPENVVKWGICEIPIYNTNTYTQSDADMINLNDSAWHNYITDDTTWRFSELDSYLDQDPNNPDATAMYSPIVPGQPMYLMLGEFAMDKTNHWGWGDGYYAPLFDDTNYWMDVNMGKKPNQAEYWSGYYRREFFESKAPTKMSAKPEVKMNLTPRGGTITITPNDKIYAFCYAIVAPDLYLEILPLINNKSSYMQWYITSYHSFMSGVSMIGYGETTVVLDDLFLWGMERGVNYSLYITSLGDENGSKQSFMTQTFKLPNPTKAPSTIEVNGIKNPTGDDVYNQVWFNIKCTSKDALKVKYIANYEREWMALYNMYIKAGYSEAEAHDFIIDQYGVEFSSAEVAAINSDEGFRISLDSRADANTILGVRVMNDEGSISTKLGQNRTIKEPADTPVQSTLFDELKGEWTATTTIQYTHWHYCKTPKDEAHRNSDECGNPKDSDEHNYQVTTTQSISSKVVIGEIGYEQTLPEHVYELFFASSTLKTKEEVDAVYNQFKTTVDDFNAHVRGQNRLLCQGFALEYDSDLITCPTPEHNDKPDGTYPTKYASPYDLFIADGETYSAYNYESPVFDFGPKWYLEIAADGTVTAPFNTAYFSPMSQWTDYVYQFVGANGAYSLPYMVDASGKAVNGHFPVTISADKNTITINPVNHTFTVTNTDGSTSTITDKFYPNIARDYSGSYQFYGSIVAPIVLTRGYNANAAVQSAEVATTTKAVKGEVESIYEYKTRQTPKSRTALPATAVAPINKVDYKLLTVEQYKSNCNDINAKRYNK